MLCDPNDMYMVDLGSFVSSHFVHCSAVIVASLPCSGGNSGPIPQAGMPSLRRKKVSPRLSISSTVLKRSASALDHD